MRQLRQSHSPRHSRGFTLLEILIAVAIVAVTVGLAVLKLEPSDGRRLEDAAEKLVRQLEIARDEAVIRGQTVAFSSDGPGYQFWLADTERNAWVALPNTETIASGQFAQGVTLTAIRVNGLARPLGERLAYSFSGLAEAFTLTLSAGKATLDIHSDALGRVEIRRAP